MVTSNAVTLTVSAAVNPQITLSSTSFTYSNGTVSPGSFTLTGSGFTPSGVASINFTNGTGQAAQTLTYTADGNGNMNITVPGSYIIVPGYASNNLQPGTYNGSVLAVDSSGATSNTVGITLTIPQPPSYGLATLAIEQGPYYTDLHGMQQPTINFIISTSNNLGTVTATLYWAGQSATVNLGNVSGSATINVPQRSFYYTSYPSGTAYATISNAGGTIATSNTINLVSVPSG